MLSSSASPARKEMQMQIDTTTGDKYDERQSKDSRFMYTIAYNAASKRWTVDCWRGEDNHWTKTFADEAKAIAEFNRFD